MKQQGPSLCVFSYMEPDDPGGSAALRWPEVGPPAADGAEAAVKAIITPDGRTVLGVEEIPTSDGILLEHLVTFSTATGRSTAIVNNLNALKLNGYEEILYTNADGSVLVVT